MLRSHGDHHSEKSRLPDARAEQVRDTGLDVNHDLGFCSMSGTRIDVATPALVIDGDALDANLERGSRDFTRAGVRYRPHAKAHKSARIARKQIEHGAVGICCAKLGEAEALVAEGISDILITTPVIGASKIRRLIELQRVARVAVVVDDIQNSRQIASLSASSGVEVDLLVELDVGQNRCGVRSPDAALQLARVIVDSPGVHFRGLQGYQGRSQLLPHFGERYAQAIAAAETIRATLDRLSEAQIVPEILTGGGTGTSTVDIDVGCLSELQPGSYIFMDTTYAGIEWDADGNAPPFRQSLFVVATVISRPSGASAIVDAGLKALSSDSGIPTVKDHDAARFSFAGDEHGMIEYDDGVAPAIGAQIVLMPSHCDTTVNLYDEFVFTRAGVVEGVWPIDARGKMQ
jgi:D-serine deaminase-like pyridoxal phosphate-dependent protein